MTRTSLLLVVWIPIIFANDAHKGWSIGQSVVTASTPPDTGKMTPETKISSRSEERSQKSAILEGTVRYESDSTRPWKLSRYYIPNPKEGWLAETVVALDGPLLAQLAPVQATTNLTMDQVNFQFVPETIALRVGDSVRIGNSDEALHNVMTSDGSRPFNVNLAKGQELSQMFDQAGGLAHPIRLGCVFHGAMRAWIYVFDHPWFAITKRDGLFRFDHVPPGTYTLGVAHPAGKLRWSRSIELKPNEKTSLRIRLSPDDLIGSK
jgi:plastocyanin